MVKRADSSSTVQAPTKIEKLMEDVKEFGEYRTVINLKSEKWLSETKEVINGK